MNDCIFCGIAKEMEPSSNVYSDERVLAFLDTTPVNSGHVLVIPKAHSAQLVDLDPEIGAQMFRVAMRIVEGLRKSGVKCEGVNLFLADGEVAFQEVCHVHMHVIPRFKDDGFGLRLSPNYGFRPKRKELDQIADRIRNAMENI